MTIRLDVTPDGKIELLRPHAPAACRFLYFDDLSKAVRIIRFLLQREIARKKSERFIPQLDADCRRELIKTIKEREANAKT